MPPSHDTPPPAPGAGAPPTPTTVNGTPTAVDAHPLTPLAVALRDQVGLTGTKLACEAGDCGSCTVLLDDVPVASCLVPLAHAAGRRVTTVEGLGDGAGGLHAAQRAMAAANASQCGFCIPGMAVTAAAVVDRARRDGGPPPDAAAITGALSGNLCRCTGYRQIVEAIADAMAAPARPGEEAA